MKKKENFELNVKLNNGSNDYAYEGSIEVPFWVLDPVSPNKVSVQNKFILDTAGTSFFTIEYNLQGIREKVYIRYDAVNTVKYIENSHVTGFSVILPNSSFECAYNKSLENFDAMDEKIKELIERIVSHEG